MSFFQSTPWGREPSSNVNGDARLSESRDRETEEEEQEEDEGGMDAESRLKRIESIHPDIAALLRNQRDLLEAQQAQIVAMRTDMNEHLRSLKEQLNPSLRAQEAMYGIRSIVAHYDKRQAATNNSRKRASSPSTNHIYPPSQRARTTAAASTAHTHVFDDEEGPSTYPAAPLVDYQAPYASFAHEARTAAAAQKPAPTPTRTASAAAPRIRPEDPDPPPPFAMSRNVHSVHELWTEYTQGLDGQPSVRGMNERYGSRWRTQGKEAVFYGLRKVIYDEVARLRDEVYAGNEAVAVRSLDQRMVEQRMPSLNRLGNVLKEEKKSRLGIARLSRGQEPFPSAQGNDAESDEETGLGYL